MSLSESPDFLSLKETTTLQRERWRDQCNYLRKHSSFFKKLWSGIKVPEDLEELPSLPLCDKEMLRRSQAAKPPYGDYLAAPDHDVIRVHRTSGTTGIPMNLALSVADAEQMAEIGARAQRASGLGPGHRVVHCLNYQLWIGGFTDHTTLERTGASVIPFGVGNSKQLIRTIRELEITAISCTPSYPILLEQVIEENFPELTPAALGLQLGLFGGEAGLDSDSFRDRLEATWGFKARNANYGVSDMLCNFAGQCEHSNDLHFVAPDLLYPELIDPDLGTPLPWKAGIEGELVLTHLARKCQPLARFRTADVIAITNTEPCPCGRTVPRFRVMGRSDEMVVVRGINVFPTAVTAVVNEFSECSGEYRIVLEDSGPYQRLPLDVELTAGNEATPALAARLVESVRSRLDVTAEISLLPPHSMPRTAGKTQRVIRGR